MATKKSHKAKVPGPKKAVGPQPAQLKRTSLQRVRASVMTEMALRGMSTKQIGEHFGVSRGRVGQIFQWSDQHGIVEEVRERMRYELLPKAERIYGQIMDATPERLSEKEAQKGYELKLKAAKQISDGIGAFRKTTEPIRQEKQTLDLEGFLALRHTRLGDGARDLTPPELPGGNRGASEGVLLAERPVASDLPDAGDDLDGGDESAGAGVGDGGCDPGVRDGAED